MSEEKKPVTELSFLLDLLLNHKLTLPTKNYIKDRIADVEFSYQAGGVTARQVRPQGPVASQAPAVPVTSSPAATAALAQRAAIMAQADADPKHRLNKSGLMQKLGG